MKITDIRDLTDRLIENDWVINFEGDEAQEDFALALEDMFKEVYEDEGVLYAFFTFATDQKGAPGKPYEWSSKEMSEFIKSSFRGKGLDPSSAIQEYLCEFGDHTLSLLAGDRNMSDYFQWEDYAKDNFPDLVVMQSDGITYLFECAE